MYNLIDRRGTWDFFNKGLMTRIRVEIDGARTEYEIHLIENKDAVRLVRIDGEGNFEGWNTSTDLRREVTIPLSVLVNIVLRNLSTEVR